MTTKKKHLIKYSLVVIWMIVIFVYSSQPANESSQQSGRVRRAVNTTLGLRWDMHTTRKAAHIVSYCVLGLLLYNALRDRDRSIKRVVLYAVIIAGAYAVTDETHQHFVPGRSPQPTDVLIDTSGAAIGASIYALVDGRTRRKY